MVPCPRCRREHDIADNFCPSCGLPAGANGPSAGDSEPVRSLSRVLGWPFLILLAIAVLALSGVIIAGEHRPMAAAPLPSSPATRLPTLTATPAATAISTPDPTRTATPVPTATATPVPTPTATPVPTSTPVPTATPAPTATPNPYRTEEFRVPPDRNQPINYTLQRAPGHLQGYVLITGGNNDIGFRVRAPNGGDLLNQSRVAGRYAFDLTLLDAGPYTVYLDNSFSIITAKEVTMYARLVDGQAGP